MSNLRRVQCGAPECIRSYHRTRNRGYQRQYRAEYASRGESYRAQWGWRSYNAQRRAKEYGVDGESIDHDTLGDRDGWICGLCQEPVDRSLVWPHLKSRTIDHVIPFRLGGTHTWDNVQIAHYSCNSAKKARIDWTPEVAA